MCIMLGDVHEGGAIMANPVTMKSWSPYVVGAGIGILSWFAFATADKHLAITLHSRGCTPGSAGT
jgi:hypothetical protein